MDKEKAVEKILREQFLWAPYGDPGDGYWVGFGEDIDLNGERFYYATLGKEGMPPFESRRFGSVEEVAEYVLRLQPDIGKWQRVKEEG